MRNSAFLAVGVLLILLQSNLYRLLGLFHLHGATPSLTLPLIIFLGVHEASMTRGAFLAFALGYATDLFASAPIGLFTFVSVGIWWLSRVAGVRLTAQKMLTRMSLTFGFALVEAAIILTLIAIFGSDNKRPLEMAGVVLPHAVSTALASPFVFWIAERLHQSTMAHAAQEGGAR